MATITELVTRVHKAFEAKDAIIAEKDAQLAAKDELIAQLKSDDAVEDANYESKIQAGDQRIGELEKQVADDVSAISALAEEVDPTPKPPADDSGETAPSGDSTSEAPIDNSGETVPTEESAPEVEGGTV